jgi:hypothetical protein
MRSGIGGGIGRARRRWAARGNAGDVDDHAALLRQEMRIEGLAAGDVVFGDAHDVQFLFSSPA